MIRQLSAALLVTALTTAVQGLAGALNRSLCLDGGEGGDEQGGG